MKSLKRLFPLIAILLLPFAANASNFPHLKTACVSYGLNNASDALLKEYASRFDFLIGPYSTKIAKLKSFNPNLKMIVYDNFTNLPDRAGTKWQLLEDYCFKNSVDLEGQFAHFSENTVITISGTPFENKLGGYRVADYFTNMAGVLVFDGTSYKNKSGDGGRYPTSVNFGSTSSSILYFGHWQKFFQLNFTFSVKGSGWNGSWEYWNGSSWASLSVNDGTLKFTKDGTVKFVPPSSWKWSKINNVFGGYWIRVRTTTPGSIAPVASAIKKESYYVSQSSSGQYLVPGWDSANDRNGDGFVDDTEFSSLVNPKATARFKYQARIPTFYWAPERYVNNLGSSQYRIINSNYVELATTTLYSGVPYDGIFEDNCTFNDGSTSPASWGYDKKLGYYTLNSGGHVIEYPGETPGIQFTKDHLATDDVAYKKLKSLGKLLVGNSSQYYADNSNYNFPPVERITVSNGTAGGYFASNVHDGTFREFWMIPKASISYQGEWSDPVQGLKSQVNYANNLCVTGNKMGFLHVRSSESTNPPDFPIERERMYSLAYFYLVNDNKNAYFVFTQGNDYSSYWWWKAIEYNIGTPLGGVSIRATGTDSAGETYYVYSREYSKVLILVKPLPKWSSKFYDSNSPVTTYNLNGTYQRLNYDGTLSSPISQISLKNVEAAILIKTGSGSSLPPGSSSAAALAAAATPSSGSTTSQLNASGPAIGNLVSPSASTTGTPAAAIPTNAGKALLARSTPRNIFTFLGDPSLMADSNAFETSNEKISPGLLGLTAGDRTGREKLIQYVLGYDSSGRKRDSVLGPIVHSQPLVVPYGNSRSVIFVGANDGMLHAFDNATAEELWGFIPYELLSRLKDLTNGNNLKYYVDGSPRAYITQSQKIVVFGLRRGGSHYYALDVTDPGDPKFLWKIGPETPGYSEIGQTWSNPQIGKIKYGSGEKVVCFIGAGYDENQDTKTLIADDKRGRAVYAVDLLTGAQVWRWDGKRDPNMRYSIPSDISLADANSDGYVDRLYVGDMGGRLWRFDLVGSDPKTWSGKIAFDSSIGVLSGGRKIFYPPGITFEKGYEMVFFGTGDPEHLIGGTNLANQIYAFKDKGFKSTFSERDLANVTDGINNPKSIEDKEGWFINLDPNKGEIVSGPAVVKSGVAYFTILTPSSDGKGGIASIYSLNCQNGGRN